MSDDIRKYGLEPRLPPVFDHQVTGTYGECERMAYYQHILGRRPQGESYTLLGGTTFHAASEEWHRSGDIEAVMAVIDSMIPDMVEDKYGRDRGRMYQLFLEWMKFQQLNPLKVLRTEQAVQVSCDGSGNCPYHPEGCGLIYGGRMDRVVEWQGMIGPLDYKTTVMDEQDPVSEYRPNHQMAGYVWAASHLMGDHCWGIIVERVICNKSKIKIARYPVAFTRDLIREWIQNEKQLQARLVYQYTDHAFDETRWAQNYARCMKPYPCAFRDVCLSPRDGGFRYKWLRDNTEERRWDFHRPDEERKETE
jgi:hypothetical protein